MCDYSLTGVKSRPAEVGDKLTTMNFGTGTRGFAGQDEAERAAGVTSHYNTDMTAVCVLPGTELAFEKPVEIYGCPTPQADTAIFRQINKEQTHVHHDCLEFPDGARVLLTFVYEGQHATVLQLPAAPKTEAEAKEQERLPVIA